MIEGGLNLEHIIQGTNICRLGGVGKRPKSEDCPNHPLIHGANHRPKICSDCPENESIHAVAELPLPKCAVKYKQEAFARQRQIDTSGNL